MSLQVSSEFSAIVYKGCDDWLLYAEKQNSPVDHVESWRPRETDENRHAQ